MELGSAVENRARSVDKSESRKLAGVEACRGLAASAVVLYHSARHIDRAYGADGPLRIFQFGHAGVDLFFVISGFVILYVHYGDIGSPGRLAHYAGRRLTRILPIYWMALFVAILMSSAGGHALPFPIDLVWSAFLIPSRGEPLLGVAWTLQYEMVFYAIFCLLILSRKAGLAVLAGWLIWIGAAKLRGGGGSIPGSLYGFYNIEFFVGMGIAYWLRVRRLPAPRSVLAAGVLLFAIAALAEDGRMIDGYADFSRLIYGIPAALILLGIVESDRQGLLTIPAILQKLGRASYSIYLFQFIFIGAAWKLCQILGLERKMPPLLGFFLLAGIGIAGGHVTSDWIEYPLMRLIRRRLPDRSGV